MLTEHHAYLCRSKISKADFLEFVKKEPGIEEVDFLEIDTLKISEVRNIIDRAYLRPATGVYKVVAVKVRAINVEAQQALLKVLEETPPSTIFFFLLAKDFNLLPTLESRFSYYSLNFNTDDEASTESLVLDEFLSLDLKDRMEMINKRLTKSDTAWVDDMRRQLAEKLFRETNKFDLNVLTRLNMIIMNLNSRGASNKMLLEEVALTLS